VIGQQTGTPKIWLLKLEYRAGALILLVTIRTY
jgi:hypothetical protein